MALPTHGRVIIDTTVGEIDIELWSKETPKTCRNFLALAMEGYYDKVIFHRVVPGFLVQTGDKTGTGQGGESFYGDPFEDEIHPRLRYAHRGLVGMANSGTKNSNDSQFFITLDRADELHGKNTLFGRCMGDTIFNVMKIGEMEIRKDGRPVYPPKIKGIRIVENPFDDIVPRITAEERRVQKQAWEESERVREERERRKSAKKNVKLLSFGTDEGTELQEERQTIKKKSIFRPDLIADSEQGAKPNFATNSPTPNPEAPVASADVTLDEKNIPSVREDDRGPNLLKLRQHHAEEHPDERDKRKSEIEKMEAEIQRLTKRRNGDSSEDDESKKPKISLLQQELDKYANGRRGKRRGKRKDEGDVLTALNLFRGKLKNAVTANAVDGNANNATTVGNIEGELTQLTEGKLEGVLEIDDDLGFMNHSLRFPKDGGEEVRKAERDYEVIDPRQRGAKAKEEEREKKRLMKAKGSRKGRW